MEKLKPCPFCGAEVDIFYAGTGTYEIFSINNKGCLLCGEPKENNTFMFNTGGIVSSKIEDAIQAWNRRTSKEGV